MQDLTRRNGTPPLRDLEGKVAVVTGAASGVGLGIARALAADGAAVVLADVEGEAASEAAAAVSNDTGVRTMAVACDVSDRGSVEALADRVWTEFSHVDVAVNNAGVMAPRAALIDAPDDDVRWVLEVNVLGVWHGCAVFGKRFVAQGSPAHILNTGSENSLGVPHTHAAAYTASKHAVLGMTDVLRRELPDHIGVSILCPGIVPSRLGDAVRNRPDRYGGPSSGRDMPAGVGMGSDEIGRLAVAGIRRGDFYIVTHPPVRELVDERYAELSRAFEAQAPRFDGDETLDTRHFLRRLTGPTG